MLLGCPLSSTVDEELPQQGDECPHHSPRCPKQFCTDSGSTVGTTQHIVTPEAMRYRAAQTDWQRREEARNNLMNWCPSMRLKPNHHQGTSAQDIAAAASCVLPQRQLSFADSRGVGQNLPAEDWPQSPEPPPTHRVCNWTDWRVSLLWGAVCKINHKFILYL